MRRKLMIKTVSMAAAFLVVNVFFAGCSERTVDYSMEDVTENTERGNGKRGLEQFADASAWEDEWTAVNTKGNTVTLQVKADVILPDAKKVSVVEVKESEMDAAFKQRVAKSVFGGGSIYYYDTDHLPKEELIKRREEAQMIYDEYAKDKTIEDPQILESMEWTLESIKHYDELLENARETYMPAEDFEVNEYLGERGGELYELSFVDAEGNEETAGWKMFSLERKDFSQYVERSDNEFGIVNVKSIPCHPYQGYNIINNQCKLSEEEAREMADRFVEEMGADYSVYAYSVPLVWGATYEAAQEAGKGDGYVFYYDAGIDDVSFVMPGIANNYQNYYEKKKETEPERYSMEARMAVYVNADGILYMNAQSPIEFTGVSEDVELLALDDIRGIIKEAVTDHFGDFRFIYTSRDWLVTFNEMELIYFRVRDKENEGHYSYVPTWRLGDVSEYGNTKNIRNAVLINAIDGSVIDFYDEV